MVLNFKRLQVDVVVVGLGLFALWFFHRPKLATAPWEVQVGIVLIGLRGEDSIAELCRKEGIPSKTHPSSFWTPPTRPESGRSDNGQSIRTVQSN